MILKAAQKYNIDISQSYMAGDDMRDVQAGMNAGCIPVFLIGFEDNERKEVVNDRIQMFFELGEFVSTL
jgi:D-glycero-D-manno-heptose 1,7-bisphosphate phosphatase